MMTSDQNEEELKAAFDAFDADRSGFITKDELRKAMQNCGASVGDKELDEMIASADANSDGKVNFEGKSIIFYHGIFKTLSKLFQGGEGKSIRHFLAQHYKCFFIGNATSKI